MEILNQILNIEFINILDNYTLINEIWGTLAMISAGILPIFVTPIYIYLREQPAHLKRMLNMFPGYIIMNHRGIKSFLLNTSREIMEPIKNKL